jgi:predicted ArsR family transcriptional regulator
MDRAVLNSMTAAEQRLVAETARDAMAGLDEEEVLELHSRVRRARSKCVSKYRRSASGAVVKRGGRGFSYPKNQRDRDKAEVFEAALASVSREVGQHAARAAAELKASRLAAAGSGGSGPKTAAAGTAPRNRAASRPRGARKTTGDLKKDASSRAAGARRQAKRDTR